MFYLIGALFGLCAVGFGAAAEHLIHPHITSAQWIQIQTALRYHRMTAIMLIINGMTLSIIPNLPKSIKNLLSTSSVFFICGGLFFSLAIEIGVALNAPALTSLAPIGGIALCLAWFCLVIAGLLLPSKTKSQKS